MKSKRLGIHYAALGNHDRETGSLIPLHDDNPRSITPQVTRVLVALCVLVFLWQSGLDGQQYRDALFKFGLIPAVLFGHASLPSHLDAISPMATIITSMFMHGGWLHLLGNMLCLWTFGDNIEDEMGHRRFLFFYIVCGVAAALAQALPDQTSVIPMIGASGAISGIMGAYLRLYPTMRVRVLIPLGVVFFMRELPAYVVLGVWFLIQILGSATADGQGGIAFGAHIGGFAAGLLLVRYFMRR
ncbi:rhomboid family intramembrane serine protease [Thioalkalivibrio sp. HK1]|uniref:rhomboid family intramembrane serine protease n=1 Tax=Thioalkalivibrio sp. HK1 TaxID=1469245 RepID=UPI0004B9DA9E|nr:rhomboid family intramembrane serine protease [Thioalkalivibrio sp. HK1]